LVDKKLYRKIFVKKHEGKRPLERSQYKKNILIDFKALSQENRKNIHLDQDSI